MTLTGHKIRVVNERELLDAGERLCELLHGVEWR